MVIAVKAHEIAYMALPKAGCSTVKAALAQVDPEARLPEGAAPDVMTWAPALSDPRFRPHRWQAYDGWWRFCVVRDPVRRLLSVYTNRVVGMRELHNCRKILRGRVDLPMDPDPDFFFQNLRAYMEAASAIKHHALPAWLFLGPDLGRYDRIYRTSELGRFGEELGARTGVEVRIARENPSGMRLRLDDLAPETRAALRTRLEEEYAYLAEFYENPFGSRQHPACTVTPRRVS